MTPVILGLGSNVGDRAAFLTQAVERLKVSVHNIVLSNIYHSPALLPQGAPDSWNLPYLNMAVAGETAISPEQMLVTVKAIEQAMGRGVHGVWGPREIDIDILAMGDTTMQTAPLTIPHPELLAREFALRPLAEVAHAWRYPVPGPYFGDRADELVDALFPTLQIRAYNGS